MNTMTNEFKLNKWSRPRELASKCLVTEWIDGRECGIVIRKVDGLFAPFIPGAGLARCGSIILHYGAEIYDVYLRDRNGFTPAFPEAEFTKWVRMNITSLVKDLGVGSHRGVWWGKGVQRGYGLDENRFSLVDVERYTRHLPRKARYMSGRFLWGGGEGLFCTPGLDILPVIAASRSKLDSGKVGYMVDASMDFLRKNGSLAAPGYDKPLGVMYTHLGSGHTYTQAL